MTELVGPISRFVNALGAEMSSAVVLELIEQLKSPYDIDFAESSMIYKFNRRGVALTFAHQVLSEVMIFTQAQLTPDPGTTFLPFPIAPVNGLDAAATRAEVLAHFGTPQVDDEQWVRYARDDRLLWFGFDESGNTSIVGLTFLDPFMVDGAPRTEPASAPEVSPGPDALPEALPTQTTEPAAPETGPAPEPAPEPDASEPEPESAQQGYLNGAHRIDADSQTVVFHADGVLLSFVHLFAEPEIATEFNGRFWSGGIVATRLDENLVTIQISPEAAAELGLPTTFEFNVDPDVVQDCYQGLEQMLRATDRLDALTVSTNDTLADASDTASAPDERLVMQGYHDVTETAETVVFMADENQLSFTRLFDTEFPVLIGWNGTQTIGGVQSLVLMDDDSELLQISAEAAEELGIGTRTRFWIANEAERLHDALVAMLEATGEFDPEQYQ